MWLRLAAQQSAKKIVEIGHNNEKLHKNRFFELRDSGSTDFGVGWDPKFKRSRHFQKNGTSASKWGMGKASPFHIGRLADIFFCCCGLAWKIAKNCFLANWLRFWYCNTYAGYHHVKAATVSYSHSYTLHKKKQYHMYKNVWCLDLHKQSKKVNHDGDKFAQIEQKAWGQALCCAERARFFALGILCPRCNGGETCHRHHQQHYHRHLINVFNWLCPCSAC